MILTALLALSAARAPIVIDSHTPLLLHHPTMNEREIVFAFAGDLWSVPRGGGKAARLTSSMGTASEPMFSPDGSKIAFVAGYDGQKNIYMVPSEGGQPRRLTYEPVVESAPSWTPDSRSVVFSSSLLSANDLPRLFEVSIEGGLPKALPLPSGSRGEISPDGAKIAYDPGIKWQLAWKRYRGGQTSRIWIAQMSDSKVHDVPRKNSNDTYPMWVGNDLYFLSDRSGPVSLYRYSNGSVDEVVSNRSFDFWSASEGPGGIVIEQPGGIKLYDFASKSAREVPVEISGDFPEARPAFKQLGRQSIAALDISPTGARAVVEARGNVFTIPVEKGDIRDMTDSSTSANRSPAWSPDGKSIAYFSDAGGEYKLVVSSADGRGPTETFMLGDAPAFYFSPTWSPDSEKVAYRDNHHSIWILDLKSKKNTLADTAPYENPTWHPNISWSPDSKWIAFHRDLDSHINAVFLYNLESEKLTQLTDGLSDAKSPVFDAGGKYLYFFASTNAGPGEGWLNLASYSFINVVSSVYCVVLRNDLPSPLAPESDEEAAKPTTPDKAERPASFRIDLDEIGQRILALPMAPANYQSLAAGSDGVFFAHSVGPLAGVTSQPRFTLQKFAMSDRRSIPFAEGVSDYAVSSNGQKILMASPMGLSIVPTAAPAAPGQGMLNLSSLTLRVDPREEWRQIYHEIWRIERDYFYDPHYHGQNLAALESKYKPFLEGVMSRDDLNFLFTDMLGEISVGHMFVGGGDIGGAPTVPGGLLGADYSLENGHYRLARVYDGENWNPGLYAPLTQPGVHAMAGEYILAIDGKDLTSRDNIYERLENTAGKQVRVKIGPNPDGAGSREVVVVPVAGEIGLRHLAWTEDNRRAVDKLSGGKLGYVHVPDTNIGGWTSFNRYYYSQIDKNGMVIDERFNHGGEVDDYMVDQMARPLNSMWMTRYGKDFSSPLTQVFGPKVLLTNEFAGSGGDYFPWHFRQDKIGPIVGRRTWGGLVGILEFPALRDGGAVTSPNLAFYNPKGTWDVENHGVDPDIEVELDPYLWRQGHDAQLERGVQEAMHLLETTPRPEVKRPAYMDKSRLPGG